MNAPVSDVGSLGLELRPLTPATGAEVGGVDLSRTLSDDVIQALRRALLDWKVLFFRDQDITTDQHLAFARRCGALGASLRPAQAGLSRGAGDHTRSR